jgi:hypothetical protein
MKIVTSRPPELRLIIFEIYYILLEEAFCVFYLICSWLRA